METQVAVYSTNELLSATNNVVRSVLQKRNVIYQFACHCDISRYVGVSPKGCRSELNNTFPNLSPLSLLSRNAYFLPVNENLPPRLIPNLLLLIQALDFIFYKIQSVLNNMMVVDSLFLPKAAPLSIYQLFFPSIYFHQNFQPRPLPTKKIRVQLRDCVLMTPSQWSFSSQSRLGFFL